MREMIPVISDDRIWHDTQERVPATESHTLALDGVEVELDLTAGNAKQLLEDVLPWLKAGHEPGTPNTPVKVPGRRTPSREAPSTRAMYKAMRRYGDEHDLGPGKGYVKREGRNGYVYEPILLAAFQAYLEERDHPWAEHPVFDTSRGKNRHASGA
jgi:hypothetical protein